LRDAPPEDEGERLALLTTINDSTDWANRLIQDLLDVASIEAGRLSIVREPERPRSLVLAALQMFEVEAAERSIELEANVAASLPAVSADEGRIVQLLGNVMRNALKFSPDGSTITVGAQAGDSEVVFSVTDRGPGIPPENRARVFERYWRSADGARHRGAGLGLSIARGIAEAHGGRMWLESEIGGGTTFYFSLPSVGSSRT
jgi:signal transduction histidine kinase